MKFDIFISYKHSDELGKITPDYQIARDLYALLIKQGYEVFCADESLKQIGSSQYKNDIDDALDSARILIVILTNAEYALSKWIQYEWDSFFNDILSGIKKDGKLFTLTKGVNTSLLPRTLRNVQNFKVEDGSSLLLDFIKSNLAPKNNSYVSSKLSDESSSNTKNRFRLIKGNEITIDDIKSTLELEATVYEEEIMQDIRSCMKYFEVNPEIYLMMKDTTSGRIVANIDIAPITDECYEKLLSGNFVDKDITSDMVLSYDMPCVYNLYFSSIVIDKRLRGTDLFLRLFNAVVEHFISLGNREVYAKRMLADAVTEEGEKFCKLFGMHKVKESDHQSKLYEVTLIPPRFHIVSKATKVLYEYYQKKYDEDPFLFDE